MSIEEQNKAGLTRVFEAINTGNLDLFSEIFAPSYSYHSPLGVEIQGSEGFKQSFSMMLKAFPDIHCEIEEMFAVEDKVATRFTMRGTFKGEWMGMNPTGKAFSVSGILVTRWVDGKEVQAWESMDTFGFYQQLGITPLGSN